MRQVQSVIAPLLIVLGLAGFVASLFVVWPIWHVRGRLAGLVGRTTDQIDEVLMRVDEGFVTTNATIVRARTAGQELNGEVQRRVAQRQGIAVEEAADLDVIQRTVQAIIERLKDRIGLLEASTESIWQLREIVNSVLMLTSDEVRSQVNLRDAIDSGRDALHETTSLLEDVADHLTSIRDEGTLAEHAEGIESLTSRIDTNLARVEAATEQFSLGIDGTRTEMDRLARRIRQRLVRLALVMTALSVWMAAAQLSLAAHGWRWQRKPSAG